MNSCFCKYSHTISTFCMLGIHNGEIQNAIVKMKTGMWSISDFNVYYLNEKRVKRTNRRLVFSY